MINHHAQQPVTSAGADLSEADLAAVVVHGRDQDPEFMQGVLDRIGLSTVAYLLPRAAGRSWYPGRFMEPRANNQPWLDHALEVCADMDERIAQHGLGPERTVLIGFSQGACLLTEHLLRRPRRYAGAALLTGGFCGPPGFRPEPKGSFGGTPVFLGSSRHDSWVPLARVEDTAELLTRSGAQVTLAVYDDREHLVNDHAVTQTRSLIENAQRDRGGRSPRDRSADPRGHAGQAAEEG